MRKKVGILTFHHGTNYGAVLQCYALQTQLQSLGYDTEVINYKPKRQEDNLYNFFRFRKFKNLSTYSSGRKWEASLRKFRAEKLIMRPTPLRTMFEVQQYTKDFDILITGSDQVFSPPVLLYCEAYGGKGVPCPTYFLGFPFSGKRIGYAVSFGVTQYPKPLLPIVREHILAFDKISVRENTGVDIIEAMGRNDAIVAPDPTLLHGPEFFHKLADSGSFSLPNNYIYSFFIRNIPYYKPRINKLLEEYSILWNNDDKEYSLEGWLSKIKHANFVITDSFHCMVMSIKLHTPFAVITTLEGKVGMNDRFYTILEQLGMEDRIIYKENMHQALSLLQTEAAIDWDNIDKKLNEYSRKGHQFLAEIENITK